jgi:hypothetical protein
MGVISQERQRPSAYLELNYDNRSMIYHELLVRPTAIALQDSRPYPPRSKWLYNLAPPQWPFHPEILRVCKQAHNEAIPILYGMNEFHFRLFPRAQPHAAGPRIHLHYWTSTGQVDQTHHPAVRSQRSNGIDCVPSRYLGANRSQIPGGPHERLAFEILLSCREHWTSRGVIAKGSQHLPWRGHDPWHGHFAT